MLGVLRAGPASGYDLRKRIDRSVGYFWRPAKTQVYAVLPRLVAAGLATRRDVVQRDRPDKQVYRITAAGRAALRSWVEGPAELDESTLLLKVFFGAIADPDAVRAHIRSRAAWAERLLQELRELEAGARGGGDDVFRALTRDWGVAYAEATLRWAARAERAVARCSR